MNINIDILKDKLCSLMCAEVNLRPKNDNLILVETPFYFADGDPYQIYIKEMPGGIIRLTDMGHTLMHLSYESNIENFRTGTRERLFEQIKNDTSIDEEKGEFFIEGPLEKIALNIFKLGQALTKINDLTFLNRARVESTFYEDLQERLYKIVGEDRMEKDYYYPEIENSEDYPIDYKIEGKHAPLFLFGIPNRDKARLTTIILERLLRTGADFDSLLVFLEQQNIPKKDLARLSNPAGEMISSLDAEDDFTRKLHRKVKMN